TPALDAICAASRTAAAMARRWASVAARTSAVFPFNVAICAWRSDWPAFIAASYVGRAFQYTWLTAHGTVVGFLSARTSRAASPVSVLASAVRAAVNSSSGSRYSPSICESSGATPVLSSRAASPWQDRQTRHDREDGQGAVHRTDAAPSHRRA